MKLIRTKELTAAKTKLEEAERKRAIEFKMKEKLEVKREKERMLELLRKDKEERFGKKVKTIVK